MKLKEPHARKVQRETALAHLAQRAYTAPATTAPGPIGAAAAQVKAGFFTALANFMAARLRPRARRP